MITNTPFFVFDVESIGLHGEGFAVGGGIYPPNGEAPVGEFLYACPPSSAEGPDAGREWVGNNVPCIDPTHPSPDAVRGAFWEQWMDAKRRFLDILMAADCGWPVEARFLSQCVDGFRGERELQGPYPFHEIASIMEAAGMNPMQKYDRKERERPEHNPLADARQSARLLFEAVTIIHKANPHRSPVGFATCDVCGNRLIEVSGRYPNDARRLVCPTCLACRNDMIREISDPSYGQTASDPSNAKAQ